MPALRWPDSGVRQDLLQQEHERTRVRIAGPLTSGSLHLCESSGGLMPLMPCPDLVTCQDAGRLSQGRSEEHTSELQSLMRISYAVFCLKKKTKQIIRKYNRDKIDYEEQQ